MYSLAIVTWKKDKRKAWRKYETVRKKEEEAAAAAAATVIPATEEEDRIQNG